MNENEVFIHGMENESYLNIPHGKGKKILLFCIALAVFSKYEKETLGREVCLVHFPRARKFFADYAEESMVYHASSLGTLSEIRSKKSILTGFRRCKRFRIILSAFKKYRKNKCRDSFGYYLDYQMIKAYLENNNVKRLISCATINRYSCWIGEIQHNQGNEYEIIPHGTLIASKKVLLPNKFWIDRVNVWNDVEKGLYIDGVCRNEKCNYGPLQYKPSVSFEEYGYDKRIMVGVFTQMDYERYARVINSQRIDNDKFFFVVMPHPLENLANVQSDNAKNFTIINGKKYIDFDIVLTGNSTIIYDLIYSGYKGKIIIFSDITAYGEVSDQVIFANDEEDVINKLLMCKKVSS